MLFQKAEALYVLGSIYSMVKEDIYLKNGDMFRIYNALWEEGKTCEWSSFSFIIAIYYSHSHHSSII